jgi:two-component system, LuxR family, response regulator FixJ
MPHRKAIHNTLGHVVLVDDDPSVRQSVHTLLKREGYRVSVYDSADALLRDLVFHTPTVLLTDVRMPGMSGVDLQARFKAMGHDLPMVFVSGESRQEEIIAAMKHGAIDFLLKPFTAQAMLDALQRAMRVASERLAMASKANQVSELLRRLTPRELEVCHWMVRGYSNQQISAVDGAAAATIKLHRSRVMEKMHANTLPELIEMLSGIELPAPVPELNASESRVLG